MPAKRSSFFDRITNVVNAPTSSDVTDPRAALDTNGSEHPMRVEVPVKESRESRTRTPATSQEVGQLLVDMYEADGNIVVQALIAGVTPENLQIAITREKITIKGRREMPRGGGAEEYHLNELYWGAFERVIDLPFEVDPDSADAVEKYGLLIVRLPRLDTNKIQELRVKSV